MPRAWHSRPNDQSSTSTKTSEMCSPREASKTQHPGESMAKNVPHSWPGRSQFEPSCGLRPLDGPTVSPAGPRATTARSPRPLMRHTTFTRWCGFQGGSTQNNAHATTSVPVPRASTKPVVELVTGVGGRQPAPEMSDGSSTVVVVSESSAPELRSSLHPAAAIAATTAPPVPQHHGVRWSGGPQHGRRSFGWRLDGPSREPPVPPTSTAARRTPGRQPPDDKRRPSSRIRRPTRRRRWPPVCLPHAAQLHHASASRTG